MTELELKKHLAYAEASVMLAESLMTVLLQRKILTPEDLRIAIEAVIDTKESFVREGEHPEISAIAAGVLRRLANSIAAVDVGH